MSARAWLLALTALLPVAALAQPAAPPSAAASSAFEGVADDARHVLGGPQGRGLSGPELDARTGQVAALLRCPVCQGLSVADSPSTAAQNMRHQIRDLLAAGYDDQQVMAYFESSYGEFVRLQPPLRGINWLLWIAPALALLGGGFVLARVTRRRAAAGAAPAAAPEPVAASIDPALAGYRDRVRALVHDEDEAATGASRKDRG
jgi:cytochrome c-type biogenesis protein CcmH